MGNLIQERRQNRQLSAGDVARLLGVSEWTVRSWEAGRTRPTKRHARALARVLKVSVEDLGLAQSAAQRIDGAGPELRPLAAAVIVRDGRVLLTERRFPGHGEQWSWPSGKVEGEESLEEAVLRELHEELLVSAAEVVRYLGAVDLPSGFRMSHFEVAIPPDVVPKLNDYEQLVRIEWMTRDEAQRAFGTLAPEIASQALILLDQVLSAHPTVAGVDSGSATPTDVAAERRAQRLAWARGSSAAPPPAPGPPSGSRSADRPARP